MRNAILALKVEGDPVKKFPVDSIESAKAKISDLTFSDRREWCAYIIDDTGHVGEFMPNLNFEFFAPYGFLVVTETDAVELASKHILADDVMVVIEANGLGEFFQEFESNGGMCRVKLYPTEVIFEAN